MYGRNFTTKSLLSANGEERERITLPLEHPLLIRLRKDVGKIPAGLTVELPRKEALALVRRRLAAVVGDLMAEPHVALNEDEAAEAGLIDALDALVVAV